MKLLIRNTTWFIYIYSCAVFILVQEPYRLWLTINQVLALLITYYHHITLHILINHDKERMVLLLYSGWLQLDVLLNAKRRISACC